MVKEASVFARLLKNGEDGEAAIGDEGGGKENAGCVGDRFIDLSELADCDRVVMGTVRWLMLRSDDRGLDSALEADRSGSSGGISSEGGMGRPLTAAMS